MKAEQKILIVCPFDSVHTARWLSQFQDSGKNIKLFPSRKFKNIHKISQKIVLDKNEISTIFPNFLIRYVGYIDFLFFYFPSKYLRLDTRRFILNIYCLLKDFHIVHLLEMQGAAYCAIDVILSKRKRSKIIVTNWGSDLFYYGPQVAHSRKIRKILSNVEYYSAECIRDYELASSFGFTGEFLPCIPNAGGFIFPKEDTFESIFKSSRNIVLIKGYGGEFGLATIAVEVIANLLAGGSSLKFHFYSVTRDVESKINNLINRYPTQVSYRPISKKYSYSEMGNLFKSSIIHLGCSRSDGISTAFLESLVHGCYPIQTSTSCADEWVKKGFRASIVKPDSLSIERELRSIINNAHQRDSDVISNFNLARELLSAEAISIEARKFYEI